MSSVRVITGDKMRFAAPRLCEALPSALAQPAIAVRAANIATTAMGRSIAFGDIEGQVHVLDRTSGEPLARVATDGSAVVGRPVLAAGRLVVFTRKGAVLGLRSD